MVRIHADPRFRRRVGRGEAGVPGSVPLHRRARIVPSDEREGRHHRFRRLAPGLLHALAVGVDGLQVAVLAELGEMGVGHAQLLALVNVRGAAVHVQQHAERLGAQLARLAVRVVAPTGHDTRLVVVAEEQAGPAGVPHGLLLVGKTSTQIPDFERHGVPLGTFLVDAHVVEQEQHVEFLVGRIGNELVAFRSDARRLADVHVALTALEHLTAHFGEELVEPRTIGTERARVRVSLFAYLSFGQFRVDLSRQPSVAIEMFRDQGDHVHAEAVDAAIHPPVHHPVHGLANLRILPIQIRLLPGELVEVVLAALRIVLPSGTAEIRTPPVRLGTRSARLVARPGRTPPIPVGMRVVPVAGGLEPGMLVGRVVDHQIHHDLQTAPVRLGEQLVHVLQRAEQRVDVLVVGDVVAVVVLRRPVDRGQPQHVHAKISQIIETAGDALQVADAVAVRVLEGTRVDLVDHRVGPPRVRGRAVGTHGVGKDGTIEISHILFPY